MALGIAKLLSFSHASRASSAVRRPLTRMQFLARALMALTLAGAGLGGFHSLLEGAPSIKIDTKKLGCDVTGEDNARLFACTVPVELNKISGELQLGCAPGDWQVSLKKEEAKGSGQYSFLARLNLGDKRLSAGSAECTIAAAGMDPAVFPFSWLNENQGGE